MESDALPIQSLMNYQAKEEVLKALKNKMGMSDLPDELFEVVDAAMLGDVEIRYVLRIKKERFFKKLQELHDALERYEEIKSIASNKKLFI